MKNYEKPTIHNVAVIPGHPHYLIYDDGRVFSIRRGKFLKPFDCGNGHLLVDLDGEKLLVHRLVAQAFITNLDGFDCVHHIDGNPANNNVSNLLWISASEHSRMHMRGNTNRARPVMRLSDGAIFPSTYAASRAIGLNDEAVGLSIRRGCRCGGSYWTYDFDDDPYDLFEDEPNYEGRNIFEEEMNDD